MAPCSAAMGMMVLAGPGRGPYKVAPSPRVLETQPAPTRGKIQTLGRSKFGVERLAGQLDAS